MAVELWLVRHGQAAFATEDYDRLTDLGRQQAAWLGAHLAARGLTFRRIAAGRLRRQQETAEVMADALGGAVETVPGLEEYDSDRLLVNAGFGRMDRGTDRRAHFQRLRQVLLDWAEARAEGAETWAAFNDRVRGAVADLTVGGEGRVIAASSGGAIALAVAQALDLGPAQMISLNLQARNTGITRLVFTSSGTYVNMVNAVPHLEHPDRQHAETYS